MAFLFLPRSSQDVNVLRAADVIFLGFLAAQDVNVKHGRICYARLNKKGHIEMAFFIYVGARGFEPLTLALEAPRSSRAEYSATEDSGQCHVL